jgi:PAS domain S-box-containing protein
MEDQAETKEQLIAELAGMRRRVAALEAAEEALRESEERTALLLQAAPLGIHECDTEGRITFVNPSQEAITGYMADELVGTYIWDRIEPGPDRHSLPAYLKHLVSEQPPPTPYVTRNIRKNGELFEIRVDWNYKRNALGQVTGFVSIVSDITERRRDEAALRHAHDELEARVEERTAELMRVNQELTIFRRFVEASRQGFAMARLNGEITYVNPAISRLLTEGRSEEIIGKHVSTVYSEEYMHKREKEVLPSILREGHWEGEVAISHRSGSIIALQNSFLVRDEQGNPAYLATVLTDITERKRAEEALVESETKYRQLIEITATGYAILDAQGRVADANDEYVRLSGHRALKEILGRSVVEWTAPYDLERNAKEVEKCLAEGTVRQLEIDYVRPDGGVTPVEINATCVDTRQGKRILSLHRDISERRQAQAALEREHRTLKHLLQSSDHERQLIAHEIHDGLAQYLAGSMMQFDVYNHLRNTKPRDAAKAYDAGMTMLRQSHADARRLISGVRPPILDEEGIAAALTHLVNEHRRKKGPKIEFHSEVEFDRLVPILENAMYRIAQEGLANACKHSNSKRVRVELTQRGDNLRITIQDWGTGFDPGRVEENRFGLAGMRERVRLLGGGISVESTLGQGTCIAVELPLMVREPLL